MDARSLVLLLHVVCSDVIVYPAPPGLAPSDKFSINVTQTGQQPNRLFVYISTSDHRSSPPREPPGRSMSWTSFAFTGAPVTVEVHAPKDFHNCLVRPSSYGYQCKRTPLVSGTSPTNSSSSPTLQKSMFHPRLTPMSCIMGQGSTTSQHH